LFIRVIDVEPLALKDICAQIDQIVQKTQANGQLRTRICPVALYKSSITEVLCKEGEAHVQQLVHSSQRGTISSEQMRTTPLPFLALRHFETARSSMAIAV